MKKVRPIIENLNKPIEVWLGKRLEGISEDIIFECPECGHRMNMTDDTARLEYGSFYGTDSCYECEATFEDFEFDVKATITVSIRQEEK